MTFNGIALLVLLGQQPRVAHLPPSGLHPSVRSNSANGRLASNSPLKSQQHQLNQAFLNDLHIAMAIEHAGTMHDIFKDYMRRMVGVQIQGVCSVDHGTMG